MNFIIATLLSRLETIKTREKNKKEENYKNIKRCSFHQFVCIYLPTSRHTKRTTCVKNNNVERQKYKGTTKCLYTIRQPAFLAGEVIKSYKVTSSSYARIVLLLLHT